MGGLTGLRETGMRRGMTRVPWYVIWGFMMSKALGTLKDFHDSLVGDDPGFDAVAEAIEYIELLEGENRHCRSVVVDLNDMLDKIGSIAAGEEYDDD